MTENDAFERRLAEALRRYAAEVDEDVDAIVVAHQVAAEHPRRGAGWRGRAMWPGNWRLARPIPVLIVMGLLAALLVATAELVPRDLRGPAAPQPTPSPSSPSPASSPTTNGSGAEYATGTETQSQANPGTSTQAGDVLQVRGRVVGTTDIVDDPRVSGTGTLQLNLDVTGTVGSEWGTYRLESATGTWEGPVTGVTGAGGSFTDISGWLAGSGSYAGYTYYFQAYGSKVISIEGIIYPGLPPAGPASTGSNPSGSPAAP